MKKKSQSTSTDESELKLALRALILTPVLLAAMAILSIKSLLKNDEDDKP